MVDCNIVGANWVQVKAGTYKLRSANSSSVPKSRCQIELDVSWEEIISHSPENEWSKLAPLRILSFDIECAGRKGIFPEPDKDPIIQIASMVIKQGCKEPFIRCIFTLKKCAPIIGAKVRCFESEAELLQVCMSRIYVKQIVKFSCRYFIFL